MTPRSFARPESATGWRSNMMIDRRIGSLPATAPASPCWSRTCVRPWMSLALPRRSGDDRRSNNTNRTPRRASSAASIRPVGPPPTIATYLIASGLNAKTIATYMGHSSVAFSQDRYGHLLPENEAEAADAIDAFLERANSAGRIEQLEAGQ